MKRYYIDDNNTVYLVNIQICILIGLTMNKYKPSKFQLKYFEGFERILEHSLGLFKVSALENTFDSTAMYSFI